MEKIRKVSKTKEINKVKENLYKELVDSFTTSLKRIIDERIDSENDKYSNKKYEIKKLKSEAIENGYFDDENFKEYLENEKYNNKKATRKSIAQDLEISEQALQNYESDRIVNTKLLPTLKNYFKVPYSTLFGEISSKDIKSAKKELAIGLTKESIDKLEKLQYNALNDTYTNNYEDKFKIFIINSIICDDTLIDDISKIFSNYLGHIEIEKKLEEKSKKSKSNIKFRNPKDEYYLTTLYRFIASIEEKFDKLAKSNATTPLIRELAFKIAKKYSKEYQEHII